MLKTKLFSGKSEEQIQEDMDTFFIKNNITEKEIVSITHSMHEFMFSILLIVNLK